MLLLTLPLLQIINLIFDEEKVVESWGYQLPVFHENANNSIVRPEKVFHKILVAAAKVIQMKWKVGQRQSRQVENSE